MFARLKYFRDFIKARSIVWGRYIAVCCAGLLAYNRLKEFALNVELGVAYLESW